MLMRVATATGEHPAKLEDPATVREFVLAGNARVTLVSRKTGTRFTYRVRQPGKDKPHFVQLLTGSDNTDSYEFFGTIFEGRRFQHSRRSRISLEAPSVVAWRWFWGHLMSHHQLPAALEVWHEGRCGRCGRALTVPSSIKMGIGPECAQHVGLERQPSLLNDDSEE
jgi:hypothetical protein